MPEGGQQDESWCFVLEPAILLPSDLSISDISPCCLDVGLVERQSKKVKEHDGSSESSREDPDFIFAGSQDAPFL